MATTVARIVDEARDYSPMFSQQNIGDLAAVRTVARLERQLAEAVVEENPEALAQWFEVNGLPADWENGIELPENLIVLGADVVYADRDPQKVEVSILSPNQSLTQPHMYPSVYVMGGKLYLTDLRQWFGAEHGWEDLVTLRVRYVPTIASLISLDETITLPDTAVSALVPNLALWMADRVGVKLGILRESAENAAQGWVRHMINLGSTRSWMVEVVE